MDCALSEGLEVKEGRMKGQELVGGVLFVVRHGVVETVHARAIRSNLGNAGTCRFPFARTDHSHLDSIRRLNATDDVTRLDLADFAQGAMIGRDFDLLAMHQLIDGRHFDQRGVLSTRLGDALISLLNAAINANQQANMQAVPYARPTIPESPSISKNCW